MGQVIELLQHLTEFWLLITASGKLYTFAELTSKWELSCSLASALSLALSVSLSRK